MPSGIVDFHAVLGKCPSYLIIDELSEHSVVAKCNFKLKKGVLSSCLYSLTICPYSSYLMTSSNIILESKRHSKVDFSVLMDATHSLMNSHG